MAVVSDTHAVTATATAIVFPQRQDGSDAFHVEIANEGANGVRIGGSDVTFTGGGALLPAGSTWHPHTEMRPGDVIYVIADTGLTSTLHLLYVGI